MRRIVGGFFALFAMVSLCSCTIRHAVQADYPRYLVNNSGSSNLPKTDRASQYFLTPNTQGYTYEFRSVMIGAANLWVVEIGKMLDDTLMSADVQAAFGGLEKVSDAGVGSRGTLTFDLQRYTFEQFGAHITLKVSLSRAGKTVFESTYVQDGKTQGGKMFWGGVFAQKNAVQQSTKLALDAILRQLITDLNASALSAHEAQQCVPPDSLAAAASPLRQGRG